jgi:hypothetical protein
MSIVNYYNQIVPRLSMPFNIEDNIKDLAALTIKMANINAPGADVNAGANANAGHASSIEQSSLDDHHGPARYALLSPSLLTPPANITFRNIVEEENAVYGTGRADPDLGAAMESHGKAVKDRVDDRVKKGPKKADPTEFKLGEESERDAHGLASARQP